MRTILSTDKILLYILAVLPVFFYVHGFLLSGIQIFQLKNSEESLQIKQNITLQDDIKNVEEVLETQEERKRLLEEEIIENEKFDKAVSLSTKLGTVKDIEKEKGNEREKVDSVKTPVVTAPIIRENSKDVTLFQTKKTPSIKKASHEKKDEVTTTDRLIINRSGSILEKEDITVKEPETGKESPVFNSVQVGGRFVESGRVEIGKDNIIFIRNTEQFKIKGGHNVRKNTVMTGFISVEQNKLKINISKVEIDGLNYRTNITICDANGNEGIVLSDVNELFEDSQDELNNIINGSLDNINFSVPMLGPISLPSMRRKDNNRLQVFFDKATEIKLLVRS